MNKKSAQYLKQTKKIITWESIKKDLEQNEFFKIMDEKRVKKWFDNIRK